MTTQPSACRLIGVCGCQQDRLCAMCLESRYMQLKGVAQSRAHRWVSDLARRVPASHQWPAGSERMLRLAKCEVSDLAKDERLLEMLAKECVEAAEREWASGMGRSSVSSSLPSRSTR